jgi:hypothetical protein
LGGLSWTHPLPQGLFQRIKGRSNGVKKVSMGEEGRWSRVES